MVTLNDQPRPDLDAAIDAGVPSLTAVDDAAVAASLRRTRVVLTGAGPSSGRAAGWRWGLAAVTAAALLVQATQPWQRPAVRSDGMTVVATPTASVVQASPARPSTSSPTTAPVAVALAPAARRVSRATVAATSLPPEPVRRGDPLNALVRAVQAIPEEAWEHGSTHAAQPLSVPPVSLSSIELAPLETPALDDRVAEPLAPGEP